MKRGRQCESAAILATARTIRKKIFVEVDGSQKSGIEFKASLITPQTRCRTANVVRSSERKLQVRLSRLVQVSIANFAALQEKRPQELTGLQKLCENTRLR